MLSAACSGQPERRRTCRTERGWQAMRFVHRDAGVERDWEVRLGRPDAVVADLAAALCAPGGRLVIDGREVAPSTPLAESGLVMGSQVSASTLPARGRGRGGGGGGPRPRSHPNPYQDPDHTSATRTAALNAGAVLRIVGGLDAGLSVSLPPGRVRLGRGGEADIRVDCRDVS